MKSMFIFITFTILIIEASTMLHQQDVSLAVSAKTIKIPTSVKVDLPLKVGEVRIELKADKKDAEPPKVKSPEPNTDKPAAQASAPQGQPAASSPVNKAKPKAEKVPEKVKEAKIDPKQQESKRQVDGKVEAEDTSNPIVEAEVGKVSDKAKNKEETNKKDPKGGPLFEKVEIVKSLSLAGKKALELQRTGDVEYLKLIQNGFESPKLISSVIDETPTTVAKPAVGAFKWSAMDSKDASLWQNVEYNRYGNRLLDTQRYNTPAHFTFTNEGEKIVHAPSNSGLQITTPAVTITEMNAFLELNNESELSDTDSKQLESDMEGVDQKRENLYSFLK